MRRNLLVLLVGLSIVLAGCGSKASGPTTQIDVTMTDFQFSPNTFSVPVGQEIKLNATNSGGVVHSFVIMQKDKSAGTEFNDEDKPNVYWEVEIQPGGSAETSFIAPSDPGEYEIVCHVPGHLQAGMVGKLNVVSDE